MNEISGLIDCGVQRCKFIDSSRSVRRGREHDASSDGGDNDEREQ